MGSGLVPSINAIPPFHIVIRLDWKNSCKKNAHIQNLEGFSEKYLEYPFYLPRESSIIEKENEKAGVIWLQKKEQRCV
jgi:hypothetical protein